MSRTIKAIIFDAPQEITIKSFEMPPCGAHEVVVETIYTFVSPGTELRVLSGAMESKGRFPLIPGYSLVGRIVEVGSDVNGWRAGELVSGRNPLPVPGVNQLWGGQASHHRYKVVEEDRPVKLPDGAAPWDYVIAEVAAISWRGVTAAMPCPNDTAVVIGQGMVGAFAAKWLMLHGARVVVMDLEETRLERAKKWGAKTVNARDEDAREQALALCAGGADIVVEASASMAGVRMASGLLRPNPRSAARVAYDTEASISSFRSWPRLVLQATYTDTLESRPGGLVPGEGALVLVPGDRTVGDRLAVVGKIARGDIRTSDFAEEAVPVDSAPIAYRELRDHPDRLRSLAFEWSG